MSRLRTIAPLAVATALAALAVATVRSAGCDDPGYYRVTAQGYELVGGCVAPGDLVVPDPRPVATPVPGETAPDKS